METRDPMSLSLILILKKPFEMRLRTSHPPSCHVTKPHIKNVPYEQNIMENDAPYSLGSGMNPNSVQYGIGNSGMKTKKNKKGVVKGGLVSNPCPPSKIQGGSGVASK